MSYRNLLVPLLALALVIAPLTGFATPVLAASAAFQVTSTVDEVDADPGDGVCATAAGQCTLRAAVQEANSDSDADSVIVPAGTYELALPPEGDNLDGSGDLDVLAPLTIAGAGAGVTVVDGGPAPIGAAPGQSALDRLLEVHPTAGHVTVTDLTLREGWTAEAGGAVYTATPGTLRLQGVAVSDSTSEVEGGGIYQLTGSLVLGAGSTVSGNSARGGGGIYAAGELGVTGTPARVSLTGATVSGNTAAASGGGVAGDHESVVEARDTTFSANTAVDGGGLYAGARTQLTVTGGSFADNVAHGPGGGVRTDTERPVLVDGTTFTGNAAGVPLDGVGTEGEGGGLAAGGSGGVRVIRSTFTANTATGTGGGLSLTGTAPTEVTDTTVRGNSADGGGGLESSAMRVTLTRLVLSQNEAAHDGGGILSAGSGDFRILDTTVTENTAENGGGLANEADGALRVERTTFADNRALVRLEDDSGLGGGVYGLGDAEAVYENVTISGNVAQARGGGLYVDADAPVHVSSSTIAGNSSPVASGIGGEIGSPNVPVVPSESVVLRNTVVAQNERGPNCSFAVGSDGGNLDDEDSCHFRGLRDRQNVRASALDALADNGGLTPTMALRPESLAVDGGVSPCPATDQRGVARPQNTRCDSGAFEFEGPFEEPDGVAPDTTYLSGPVQDTEATSTFTFTGTDDRTATEDLTFECRLLETDPAEAPEPVDPTEPPDPADAFTGCPTPWQVPLVEEGQFRFEVRATDRAGNTDPTPAVHEFEQAPDVSPPETVLELTPSDPSGTTVAFTFSATDNATPPQFLEYECRLDSLDTEAWLECTNPAVYSGLAPGSHTFQVRATDGGDNVDPSPATFAWTVGTPASCDDANATLLTQTDTYVDEALPLDNFQAAESLVVRSQAPGSDARALVRFELPPVSEECVLEGATLRLHSDGEAGRTLEALAADASWDEAQVTWRDQPGTSGAPVTTTSGAGYREWDLTTQVAGMLDGSAPNHGWLVRDAAEEDESGAESSFVSSEAFHEPPIPPQLVLRFAADDAPPPPAPVEPAGGATTVTCGQTITQSIRVGNDLDDCMGEGLVVGAPDIVLDLGGHTLRSGLVTDPGQEEGLFAGVRNAGHANVVIRNGTVEGFGYGVRLLGQTQHSAVRDITLRSNVLAGVELFDADNGRTGVTIESSAFDVNGDGVTVVNGTEGARVEGNTFTGNLGRAVYAYDASRNRIAGNTVSGLTGDPLLDSDGGIVLEASSDNTVVDNVLSDIGDAAVALAEGSHRNVIESNTSTRSSDSGVSVSGSDGNRVRGNRLHLSGGPAISLSDAHDGEVTGNDVRFNPGGVVLEGANGNLVEANDASRTEASGISVAGGLRNRLLGNTASDGGATGIAVEAEAVDAAGNPVAGNVVSGNTVNGNLQDGISVVGSGHEVAGNQAHNNAAWGISAAEGTIDGGSNEASGNGEPGQCVGVACGAGTAPPAGAADVEAPDTVLTGTPADGSSSSSRQAFTFTGSDDVTPATALRFECRLDAPPDPEPEPPEPGVPAQPPDVDNWRECSSPHVYDLLLEGEHTFEVRAIDPADNIDLTPATFTWTIVAAPPADDTVPPSTTIASGPADPSTTPTAEVVFHGSDNSTPGRQLRYECRLDGGDWLACTSPATYQSLALGEHVVEVRAVDLAGHADPTPATHTWTVVEAPADTTPPDTVLESGPDAVTVATTATFTFSSDEAGATFECSLDGAVPAACSSPAELTGLAEGPHVFTVRAVDAAGNVDETPAVREWDVRSAPTAAAVTCGEVITQSTRLTSDLLDCPGDGVVIGAPGITLDLDGRTVDGTGLGAGVRNDGHDLVTITGGTVQEFDHGVELGAGTAGAIVDGMTLQLNQLSGAHLVDADDGSSGSTVRHSTFTGNATGLHLEAGTQAALVHDNTISGSSGQGVHVVGGGGNVVRGNHLSGSADSGVQLEGSSGNTIAGNEITTSADASLSLELASNDNLVEGNTVTEGEGGVLVSDSSGNRIVANTVHGMADVGVDLETSTDTLVLDNDLRSSAGGISVEASTNNRIEGNDASESAGVGIEVGDGSLDNELVGNRADSNEGEGIAVSAAAAPGAGNLLEGNTASGNAADGIFVGSVAHMIRGNTANRNGGWGIYSAEGTVAGANVDGGGNRASGNVGGGLDPATQRTIECFNIACEGGAGTSDQTPPDTSVLTGPDDPTVSTSATLTFSGTDDATDVTFECRLDGGAFAPCSSPATYSQLPLGSHTFEVRAVDWVGNVDPTPAVHVWLVEAPAPGTAPETSITGTPDARTTSTTATFTVAADEDGVSYECALDGGDFAPCASPVTYADLAVGTHSFLVRATDAEGNTDPTPATYSWEVAAPPVPRTVSCGTVLTESVQLLNDLTDCGGDGLVVGASGITVDLAGRVVDGTGLGAGVRTNGFDSVAILGGIVQEFGNGVQLDPGTAASSVSSVTARANQVAGIALLDADDGSTVRTSTVTDNSVGILVGAGTVGAHVHDNTLTTSSGDGLLVEEASGTRVERNRISGSSGSGVHVVGGDDVVVMDNRISASSTSGVSLEAGADGTRVQGNTISTSGSDGIGVADSARSRLVGNAVSASGGVGISLDGAADATVTSNDVRGNAGGISLSASTGSTVEANNASAGNGGGIEVEGESFGNVIRRNTANGNSGEGISVAGSAPAGQGNLVASNTTNQNSGDGISVPDSGHTITGNSASSNDGWGIFAGPGNTDGGGNTASGNAEPSQCSGVACTVGPAPGAPDTQLVETPPNPSSSRNALFTFTGTDDTTSAFDLDFQCRLDSADEAAWVDCENPQEYADLAAGEHTFEVRAIDLGGSVDATPATYTWSYTPLPTGVAPDTTIEMRPAERTPLFEALFTFSSNEPDVTFECSLDGAAYAPCAFAAEYEFAETEVGAHTFRVRATDPEGLTDPSPAEYTWTITGIVTTVTSGPAFVPASGTDPASGGETEERSATFTFEANVPDATFVCSLDLGPFAPCTSPVSYSGLAVGEHILRITASDAEGAEQLESTEYEWTIVPGPDVVPPDTVVTAGPEDTTTGAATFTFTGTDDVTSPSALVFECSLDSAAEADFAECTSPWTYPNPDLPEPLSPGEHVFHVRALDLEDNVDPTPATVAFSWTGDAVAPLVAFTGSPATQTSAQEIVVTFSVNDPYAGVECSLDGAPFEECVSPHAVSVDVVGSHTLLVRATDLSGNTGPEASHTWTLVGPPETTVLTGPPATTADTTAAFTFESSVPDSTFTCSLDGGPFLPCESPATYTDLGGGGHTLAVAATAPGGHLDESPATWDWAVEAGPDTTAPETAVVTGPDSVSPSTTAQFTFSSPDPGASFECALDAGSFADCPTPYLLEGLTEGTHTLDVRAVDAAGNADSTPATWTWTVDGPPQATITLGPEATTFDTSATFQFVSDEPDSTFECSLDGAAFTDCSPPVTYFELAVGEHDFAVRATAGSLTQAVPTEWEWDVATAAAPETTIDGGPSGSTTATSASLAFSASAPATFECSLDAAAFTPCTSPVELSDLAVGQHEFRVRASDAAGNVEPTPASVTWTVEAPPEEPPADVTAPETTVVTGPPATTPDTSATFELGSDEPGSTFECSLDGAAFEACPSPLQVADLTVGEHSLAVRAVDAAGNVDQSPATHVWTVQAPADSTPPETALVTATAGETGSTSASFTFSSPETGVAFECTLDGGTYEPCSSPKEYAGLAAGSHTFQVRAVDGAGNADPSPATHTWSVEAQPVCTATTVTRTAEADAWVDQGGPSSNLGSDSVLKVMSKADGNMRALVRFALPSVPSGCALESATLRINAKSARTGRTLQAIEVAAPWTEGGVTWANQPGTRGAAATATSGEGWREWAVADQVSSMYAAGGGHGFLVRDAVESQDHEQQFNSREAGSNPAQLVIRFAPPPPPDPAGESDATTDSAAPDTSITSGPGSTSTAAFAFGSTEAGSTFQCSLDGGAFDACTSPATYGGLPAGTQHTFAVRAVDAAGSSDPSPATVTWTVPTATPVDCGSGVTVRASADAWVDQASPSVNKGDDSALKVRSKSGEALRSLVAFTPPAPPQGCEADTATLRLFSNSAKTGRVLQALAVTSPWSEGAVTWATQPTSGGAPATTASGNGWREWNVGEQVRQMQAAGAPVGFLVRDADEGGDSEQSLSSREDGNNRPELVLRYRPS